MGRYLRNFPWDPQGALREFDRAIELNPSYAEAHGARAVLLTFNRRFDESISAVKRALDLDPVSGDGASYAGTVYLYTGLYDDAIRKFKQVLEDNPDSLYAKGNMGLAYVRKGMFEEGLELMDWTSSTKYNSAYVTDLTYALAASGKIDELKALLEKLLAGVLEKKEWEVAVAGAYANLGNADEAIAWLERAMNDRVSYMASCNSDFVYDPIRSDPRFQALMRKMGYTNAS